jgi:hypothetical protein
MGVALSASNIEARAVILAIPDVFVSSSQWNVLYNACQYGLERGVSVQYLVVTG